VDVSPPPIRIPSGSHNPERGLKVSNEFTIPLCRGHHRQLHQAGDKAAWWDNLAIKALEIANLHVQCVECFDQ
jgi:hypothetical protein